MVNFCSECGGPVEHSVPAGDDRTRAVCTACGHVHYRNPRVVVGCLADHEGALLLCRRAIEPARGKWTPPAGFLELREGALEGARRETREEACAEVEVAAPHAWLDLPHIGQTYALFRGRLVEGRHAAGAETLETALFAPDAIPWDELAFPVMHFAVDLWLADRRAATPRVHQGVVHWNGQGDRFDPRAYELREHFALPLA